MYMCIIERINVSQLLMYHNGSTGLTVGSYLESHFEKAGKAVES